MRLLLLALLLAALVPACADDPPAGPAADGGAALADRAEPDADAPPADGGGDASDAGPLHDDAAARGDAAAQDADAIDATSPDAAPEDASAPDAGPPPLRCPTIGPATALGRIADARLAELSGLAASPTQPDILWAHHDNAAYLFALDRTTLAVRARYALVVGGERAPEGDLEDLAIGGGAIYLGDIGDNHAGDDLTVYRALEPVVPPASVDADLAAEAMTVDPGPLDDAEALLLDPIDGHLFGVEKDGRPYVCDVGPVRSGASSPPACGTRLRDLSNPSSGAVSPDGAWVVLRNEEEAFLWHRAPGAELLTAFLAPPGLRCPMPTLATPTNSDECNGEAIAFSADGQSLLTASERSSAGGAACPNTSVHAYTISY